LAYRARELAFVRQACGQLHIVQMLSFFLSLTHLRQLQLGWSSGVGSNFRLPIALANPELTSS
jgi:hypothetical protein